MLQLRLNGIVFIRILYRIENSFLLSLRFQRQEYGLCVGQRFSDVPSVCMGWLYRRLRRQMSNAVDTCYVEMQSRYFSGERLM